MYIYFRNNYVTAWYNKVRGEIRGNVM